MAEHALLSASGSKKWLTCTPSARLEEKFPDEESEFASEGTKAHELVEYALRHHYFDEAVPEHLNTTEKILQAGYTSAMIDAAWDFLQECRKISDPLDADGVVYTVLVEQRLDYSSWVPQGFGTGDFCLITNSTAFVRDFKYGKGVEVESIDNSQMKLYGLGAYHELAFAYEGITDLDIGIVQPRIHNVSSCRVSLADLLLWAESIKPIAELAWAGEGELVPGPHCRECFCKARFSCKARTDMILAAAGDRADANTLLVDEVAELLPQLDEIEKWAKAMKAYTLAQAVDNGVKYPGWKLVEGRSNRYITDPKTAAVRLVANGVAQEKIFTTPELVGVTALEEAAGGKKRFTELLGDLIAKPAGKPTLVPIDDRRAEWKPAHSADEDFCD